MLDFNYIVKKLEYYPVVMTKLFESYALEQGNYEGVMEKYKD